MADEHHSFTYELASAKYFTETPATIEPEWIPVRRVQPRRSGMEQAFSWLNKLVPIALLLAAGTWFCFNRANINTSRLRERTSSPIDIVLWLCGFQAHVQRKHHRSDEQADPRTRKHEGSQPHRQFRPRRL